MRDTRQRRPGPARREPRDRPAAGPRPLRPALLDPRRAPQAEPLPRRTVDVALTGGPQLSGVLRSTSGDVVANALVCIDTAFASGRICRETDGNGRYAITTRAETYIVSVIPPEHSGLVGEYWDGKRN